MQKSVMSFQGEMGDIRKITLYPTILLKIRMRTLNRVTCIVFNQSCTYEISELSYEKWSPPRVVPRTFFGTIIGLLGTQYIPSKMVWVRVRVRFWVKVRV